MRKYYKRLFCQVVLVIVAVAFISVVVYLTIFLNPFFEQNPCVENFRERKNDYISVCDEVIELSKENNWFFDEGRYYFIDISTDYDNHQAYFISYEYKTPYTNYPEYRLSDEIARNCKKIYDSFPSEHGYEFDFICYRENRISFHSENGRYAIVYSVDDKRPNFWLLSSEEDDIKVKKITKNWYHMWR